MDIKEIRSLAKDRMKGVCNLCSECNGIYCSGQVPGMGGTGSGRAMKRSYEKISQVKLNLKTIHEAKKPETNIMIFNQNLSLPLISAPVTGSEINMGGYLSEADYCKAVVSGSKMAGTFAMIGDSGNPQFYIDGLNAITEENGCGIAIIKPRENNKIIENIKKAEIAEALAVGVDIDGAGLVTMALLGQPVGPKSKAELKEIISSTNLPVILKGIMTVEEALLAVEIGAKAIVVSNHGGRILDDTLAPIEVLPMIAKAVKGKITIMADGSVRSGRDIFKYIAAGADVVLCARPIIWGAIGGGSEGVASYINHLKNELIQAMILTGANNIAEISSDMISYNFDI